VNSDVNDHWLCDFGRFSYERYETDRVVVPKVRNEDEYLGISTWVEAVEAIAAGTSGAKNAVMIFSANMTSEEAAAAKDLAGNLGARTELMVDGIGPIRMKSRTEWLYGTQAAPNYRGVRAVLDGVPPSGPAAVPATPEEIPAAPAVPPSLEKLLTSGAAGIDVLYVCDAQFSERTLDPAVVANLRQAKFLVVHSWDATHPLCDVADVVLPSTTHVEKEGTFTNLQNLEQQIYRAYPPKGQSVGDEETYRRVADALTRPVEAPASSRA
jgi:predicted molibdopterin-dependent oxidoreductase YjgC